MNHKITLLLGGTAALFALYGTGQAIAQSNPQQIPNAQSYADLLDPIPNAVELLKADNFARVQQAIAVQQVQFHHHHHHHHHSFFPFGLGFGFGSPDYYSYGPADCYWTWSRPYWNGYRWTRRRIEVCD